MRRILIILCLAALMLTTLYPLACSGGGKGKDDSSTPAATRSDQSTTPPTGATPTEVPDPFAALQSYRYSMQMTGEGTDTATIKGSVKAPDSIALDFYVGDSDTPINSLVIIGQQAWIKSAALGDWQTVDVAEAKEQISGLLPKDFWGTFPMEEVIALSTDQGEETINGVQARHYLLDEATPETLAKLAEIFGSGDDTVQPEAFSMDLWRTTDGWPVKATISSTYPSGSEIPKVSITWEVSDVDSSAVSVQPPA